MINDIVTRLRCYADIDDAVFHPWVYAEAADEIERLREALREVLHIADGYGSSSGRLAGIVLTASAAFEGEKTDTMRTLVDKINQQAIAIAERDEFIEIIGMCNEFEEFLSK